jgi:membrane protease YdiL (CAAX protease family)
MPDTVTDSPPPEPIPAPPRKRGLAWLAWIVILLVVVFEVFGASILRHLHLRLRPGAARTAEKEHVDTLQTDLQVRALVGFAELSGDRKAVLVQAHSLNTGPLDQRLPYIVLVGDLGGPDQALEQIAKLREQLAERNIEPDTEQEDILDALERLYHDREDHTKTLTDADRDLLRQQLGWKGELALTPSDDTNAEARQRVVRPARRLAVTFFVAFFGGGALCLVGLVGLIAWAVLFFIGTARSGLPPPTNHGGIYAESFAVYMVVFLALGIGHRLLKVPGPELLLTAAAMLLSLGAGLLWPVLRGVPWRQVRREVGLTLGRRPWLEPIIGLGGYALVLPIFGVGIIVSSVLIQYERRAQVGERPEQHFAPVEQPSHPIVEWLQNPDWSRLAQVVLVACVLAPLVEETMFRGALYRHLRNATAGLGRIGSFLLSAIVVSFLFAVIHPQGVLAVPALISLALGLTVLREWRGSLLPSMIVHGIHNGLTTFVLVQALRD